MIPDLILGERLQKFPSTFQLHELGVTSLI